MAASKKAAQPQKKQVSTIHLDNELHGRLLKVIGLAAIDGVKLSYRMIVTGVMNSLSDNEILKASKKQAVKEAQADHSTGD